MRLRLLVLAGAIAIMYAASYCALRLTHTFTHREWAFNEYARSHFIQVHEIDIDYEFICELHRTSLKIYYPIQVCEIYLWYQIRPLSTLRRHTPNYFAPTDMNNDWDGYSKMQTGPTPYHN